MIINSKFHDYYDVVAKSKGIDKAIEHVYKIIGFCGKLIPFEEEKRCDFYQDQNGAPFRLENQFYFGESVIERLKRVDKFWWFDKQIEHYSELLNGTVLRNIFSEYHVPVFLFGLDFNVKGDSNLILNPNLKEIQFYKVIEPFTAFQDIEMYLSGVLGNKEKVTMKTSDKDLLVSKGFDPKWSFRKMSERKK